MLHQRIFSAFDRLNKKELFQFHESAEKHQLKKERHLKIPSLQILKFYD